MLSKEIGSVIKHKAGMKHIPETENLSVLGKLDTQIHSVFSQTDTQEKAE